jgi:hypothetical protein
VEKETPNGDGKVPSWHHDSAGTAEDANEETEPNAPVALDARQQVDAILKDICEGRKPQDNGMDTASDLALNQLHHKDFPALRRAVTKLAIKSCDKKLNVFF